MWCCVWERWDYWLIMWFGVYSRTCKNISCFNLVTVLIFLCVNMLWRWSSTLIRFSFKLSDRSAIRLPLCVALQRNIVQLLFCGGSWGTVCVSVFVCVHLCTWVQQWSTSFPPTQRPCLNPTPTPFSTRISLLRVLVIPLCLPLKHAPELAHCSS